jgi:serine/threonine-protein kinase
VIDRYQVERWIGGGGAGAVYRARHLMIGQPVALKLMRRGLERDAEAVARFRREAQAAAAIGHPRIPRVLDLGVTGDGRPFLVMDLLEGRDLRALFEAEAPMPPEHAVDLTVQILEGLDAAHRAGIVHRDIKPANVFVVPNPEGRESVRLLDFGLSRMTEPMRTGALTAAGAVLGTPYYMAPEQAAGASSVDHRADLYSTAVLLYQALSRALPFPGDSVESVLVRIASSSPVPLAQVAPGTPPALVAVVERGMARDPAARWPTAQAFARALLDVRDRPVAPVPPPTRVIAQAPVPSVPAPVSASPRPVSSSGRVIGIVAVLVLGPLVLLAVFGAVVAVTRFMSVRQRAAPSPVVVSAPGTALAPPSVALAGPENSPEAVRAAVATTPVPPAPAPAGPKRPVTFGLPVLEGPLQDRELRALLSRARPSLDVCRPTGPSQRVRLRFAVDPAGALSRTPYAGNEGDIVVSSCVASRLEAERLPPGNAASFRVEVALASR